MESEWFPMQVVKLKLNPNVNKGMQKLQQKFK